MKPQNIDDVFAEIGQAEFEKHRARSDHEWAQFVRDRNKYLEWERQASEMFNVCDRILTNTGLWACAEWVVDNLHRLMMRLQKIKR